MAVAVYPGSFNPPTVAHLAIAEAALAQCGVDRVDLVLSRHALGKEAAGLVPLGDRLAVLDAVAATRPGLAAAVSEGRLVAEIAAGYDVVVLGADKWAQVTDPFWYGGDAARRDAVDGRPAPRGAGAAGRRPAGGPDPAGGGRGARPRRRPPRRLRLGGARRAPRLDAGRGPPGRPFRRRAPS